MDPISVFTALAPKLITLGIHAHKAMWAGGLGVEDAKALKALIDISGNLVKTWRATHPAAENLEVLARHSALVGGAFIAAFHAQDATWGKDRDRRKDIAACLTTGQETAVPGGAWDQQSLLLNGPVRSATYQRLWSIFRDAGHVRDDDAEAFARLFRQAWAQLLRTDGGQVVRDAMTGATAERARMIRRLIADDLVSWRGNHVFGNQRQVVGETPLPLDQMYVEPQLEESGAKVLTALHDWLDAGTHNVAAVTAPFGRGKSLTARMFAADLAEAWLAAGPGADVRFPVFVHCATRLDPTDLMGSITEALQVQLNTAYGHEVDDDEPGVCWPADRTKLVVILDGLDEVHLAGKQVEKLFKAMGKKGTARFVVFSRPRTLPRELKRVERLPLANFEPDQVRAWLAKWNALNQTAIQYDAIEAKALTELTDVPILLYMIARTWDELPDRMIRLVEVYGRFFDLLAVTKINLDEHRVVKATAEQMLDVLRRRGELGPKAEPKDALVWLLARLAWEHARCAFRETAMGRFEVEKVLRDELQVGQAVDVVLRGLMLVMQTGGEGTNPEFNFSHRSFQEFLIACHWRNQLVRATPDERALMGARLIARFDAESKTEAFLLDMLRNEVEALQRDAATRWAEACFRDARLGRHDGACADPTQDERCYLREAAIAIRCQVDETPLVLTEAAGLRSLAAIVWLQGGLLRLHAPRLLGEELWLYRVVFDYAGADLSGADLRRTYLGGAELGGANLGEANLRGAELGGANLGRANLRGANLRGANLRGANLLEADLRGANLGIGTDFPVRNLRLARNLHHAMLPDNVGKLLEGHRGKKPG